MGLSDNIHDIIEGNYEKIISSIPFKDILIKLRAKRILTEDEVDQLDLCSDHQRTGFKFLKILRSRSDADFFKFCDVLKSSTVDNIQSLGRLLENSASDNDQAQGKSYSYLALCFVLISIILNLISI